MKKLGCYEVTGEFGTNAFHTFTCGHCNKIHIVKPKEKPEDIGGHCSLCWSLVCANCVGRGCDPFEKKLKRAEDRERTRRYYT